MTQRERILAVYKGETPDCVPFMLDLSHWFYQKHKKPWDLSVAYTEPEYDLIDYHKKVGAGFYMPNLAAVYSASYPGDVRVEVEKETDGGRTAIVWRYHTPIGSIERRRIWEESNYAWGIRDWAIKSEHDLRVLGYAVGRAQYAPRWDRYQAWVDYIGNIGVAYIGLGYSGVGHLLNYWMGIEGTMFAIADWPDTVREVVDQINESNLRLVDLVAQSPAEVIIMGDNISSDIQPPRFWNEWSRPYYAEAFRRLHAAGKHVAVHVDGKMRGALKMIADAGADCCDAATPVPMGDLNPQECRDDAGDNLILSGGVSPDLWLPTSSLDSFKRAVTSWLQIKARSPRLIAAAGDQVPPGADERRIEIMRDLVESFGQF
jgi:hypothetical protein